MAKTFVTVEVTKAERKTLDKALATSVEVENMRDKADDLEYQAEELRDEAYRIEDEGDADLEQTVDAVQDRLWTAAQAEAEKLNKANKDLKYEFVVEDGKDGRIPLSNGEYEHITMPVIKKVKRFNPLDAYAAVLKKAGYTVTAPKATK